MLKNIFDKFPEFSPSGKMNIQIPCFPCVEANLVLGSTFIILNKEKLNVFLSKVHHVNVFLR